MKYKGIICNILITLFIFITVIAWTKDTKKNNKKNNNSCAYKYKTIKERPNPENIVIRGYKYYNYKLNEGIPKYKKSKSRCYSKRTKKFDLYYYFDGKMHFAGQIEKKICNPKSYKKRRYLKKRIKRKYKKRKKILRKSKLYKKKSKKKAKKNCCNRVKCVGKKNCHSASYDYMYTGWKD